MPGNDIGAGIQHALGEAFGVEAFGLEVLEHCPGAPPAHELGLHGIDSGPNEGHTAAVAEGAGADVAGLKAQGGTHDRAGGPQGMSEVTGGELVGGVAFVESIQRSCGARGMQAKVEDLLERGFYGSARPCKKCLKQMRI